MNMHSGLHSVVANMVNWYGCEVTIVIQNAGVYDPETQEYVASETSYQMKAIFLDKTLQSNGLTTMKESLIQTGDQQIYLQPLEQTNPDLATPKMSPLTTRIIAPTGKAYRLVTYKQINPTFSDLVLIDCYVREEGE